MHTVVLSDREVVALQAAIHLLKDDCNLHIANDERTPYLAHLHSIESIQTKLSDGAQQTSGNTF